MKRKLEDFIRENRSAFDDKEPSVKSWNRISAALGFKNQSIWNSVAVWRAAALIFMCLSVYLLVPKQGGDHAGQAEAMNEFRDVEAFYIQQIADKVRLIDEFERMEGLNGFTQDFHQLEAMYQVLREEMKTRPSQKVKDALVLNLLVRIDLLNQQLHKLESSENEETTSNHASS